MLRSCDKYLVFVEDRDPSHSFGSWRGEKDGQKIQRVCMQQFDIIEKYAFTLSWSNANWTIEHKLHPEKTTEY